VIFRYDLDNAIYHKITSDYRLFRVETPFDANEAAEYEKIETLIARTKYDLYKACPDFGEPRSMHEFVNKLNRLIREGGGAGALAARLKQLYFRRKRILLLAASRVPCGVALVRLLLPGSKIILFTERIATANALYRELSALYPNKVGRYHSKMEAVVRELALEDYRSGKTRVLICCRALDEGLNVPDTDVGIILSSTSGARQRIQRLGRILRKTPGDNIKRIFYVYVPGTAESPMLLPQIPPVEADCCDSYGDMIPDTIAERTVLNTPGAVAIEAICEAEGTEIIYDPGMNSIRLIFDPRENSIDCSEYDAPAAHVIETLRAVGASKKQIANAVHFLKRGIVDPQWNSTPEDAARRLAEAPAPEKNYRTVMLLLARSIKPQ
jgi:hypothetical protein